MLAALFTLGLFLVWSAFGVALLVALGADLQNLRVSLTAPILGSAAVVAPLYALSALGVSMRTAAPPVFIVLVVGTLLVLALRRPHLSWAVMPVVVLCVFDLVLLGRPMFHFGFDWLANANGDMAFYVLAATQLMGHGVQSSVDHAALAHDRGFASSAQGIASLGLRPGVQVTLGGLAAVLGRPPVTLYMPLALSMTMSGVCATGALAMQASRKWWVAAVAAGLIVVSPLAGYGVLQQLIPQNWGLGLSAALFAWLMRPEMHEGRRPPVRDLAVVSLLAVAVFAVASEVAAALIVGYVLYVAILLARRRVSVRAVAILWAVPLAAIALMSSTFFVLAISYLRAIFTEVGTIKGNGLATLFGYSLVPTALPAAFGVRSLFLPPTARDTVEYLIPAALLFAGVLIACFITTRRGVAAGAILAGNFALALFLAKGENAFGLFKLYMYMQPFLAATIAVFLAGLRSRWVLGLACAVVALMVVAQVPVLNRYVNNSRNPIDLRNASAADVLPKFRRLVHDSRAPVVPVSDNFALATLFGASAGNRPLYFVSRNVFDSPWKTRHLDIPGLDGMQRVGFRESPGSSRVQVAGNCVMAFPTGSQLVLNRRTLPEGSTDFLTLPCNKTRNDLMFITSSLGQPATLPQNTERVSFWQLEKDPSFPGQTFSGFGRYALFQVLGGTSGIRAVLDFTTSPTQGNRKTRSLPRAAMSGVDRAPFPVVGGGSARVISPPLTPQVIGGLRYVVLDMGRVAQYQPVARPGLSGLWGKSIKLDPRRLTSYVRDVSLISVVDFRNLRAPDAIHTFPADLGNPGLEYSGIFEDGWLSQRSYAVLVGGAARTLIVRASVLPIVGQRLDVIVNGKSVFSKTIKGGPLDLSIRLPASAGRRKIELRWGSATRLGPNDPRAAPALLSFLGFLSLPTKIEHFPADLHVKSLVYSGIYDDGWIKRESSATLAGGNAATLVIQSQVPEARGQRLTVFVNGKRVANAAARPGTFTLRVHLPAVLSPRTIELVWAKEIKLRAPDARHASAQLQVFRIVPRRHP